MTRPFARVLALTLLLGAMEAGSAPDEPPLPAGYTAAELSALDRALHAVNCTREDLRFRRDLAEGHGCFPLVRDLLHRPLGIVSAMAAFVSAPAGREGSTPVGRQVDQARRAYAGIWTVAPARSEGGGSLVEVRPGAEPRDPDALIHALVQALEGPLLSLPLGGAVDGADAPIRLDLLALRRRLPEEMAWHDVFPSPFDAETEVAVQAHMAALDPAWAHAWAARIRVDRMAGHWLDRLAQPQTWHALPPAAFPVETPLVVETPHGRIALGTMGDDVYTGEYTVLIEPGGNDRYVGCRLGASDGALGRPVAYFADLGGDDVYACRDVDFTLGAALLGLAAFYDLGAGDDRYEGGHASLGAAMGGIAVFHDDGGSDVYEGKTFTQGAAGFGIGIFHDGATQDRPQLTADEGTSDPVDLGLFDNDRLSAWANAQAFARCRGVALCINDRGNDVYQAGGVYLHAPLFADRYQSFSQGFAIGQRNIDYAGGIAMLLDHEGNDRYLGDVYDQGVGYWYAAGFLWDGAGNDTYEMTQYGQGSGIHLAVGGLVDAAGNDTYVMHAGLGQGGSHDYGVSILHDRGGNDRYLGTTSCNGSGLTNSVGLHIDRSGDDVYAGRKQGGVNFGRPARGFSSLGILLDLEGEDDYLGVMADDAAWRQSDLGVGIDLAPPLPPETGRDDAPAADAPRAAVEVPAICSYDGPLTSEVFEQLWALACRWEVGDNREVVPRARARLIAFGPAILEPLHREAGKGAAGGLELRAWKAVLEGLIAAGAGAEVEAFLRESLLPSAGRRSRLALHLAGELRLETLGPAVLPLLEADDEAVARRAAGVLERIGSRAGDELLHTWLAPTGDELRIRTALPVVLAAGTEEAYATARPLLDHPLLSVRGTLSGQLGRRMEAYARFVDGDLADKACSNRARRTLLDALVRTKGEPSHAAFVHVLGLLGREDWGIRTDAARLLRAWTKRDDVSEAMKSVAEEALERLLEAEKDPFVRFAASAPR